MTKSWDARAFDTSDVTWHRGQIGLFAIFEWILMLDCFANYGDRIRVVPFEKMFFGTSASTTYGEWMGWASGVRALPAVVEAFEKKLVEKVAPDQERSDGSRYATLLDRYDVSRIDALVRQIEFAQAKFVGRTCRAYVDANAEPLAGDMVDLLRTERDEVVAYATMWIKARRNRYAIDPGASPHPLRALEILADALIPDVPAPRGPLQARA